MLTVEELVIESLYHRLVLVNVKKQLPGPSHTPGDGTNIDDEIDESVDDVVEGAAGGDAGGGGDAAGGGGDAASGSTSRSATGGLGFLVMNAMNPYLKRAYGMTPTFHLGKNLIPALPAGEAGQGDDGTADRGDEHTSGDHSGLAEELLSQQGFDVTEDIQMMLNTGEIQLMKTTLRSPELQVEMPPTWNFGPSLSYDLSSVSPEDDDGTKMVLPRGISLDNCEQFSIVKLQDKRDPSGRSLVMVQTNEPGYRPDRLEAPGRRQALPGAKVLRKAKSLSEADPAEIRSRKIPGKKALMVSPAPAPALTNDSMSIFVQPSRDLEEEEEEATCGDELGDKPPMFIKQAENIAPQVRDAEIDSGIWDMVHGLDSRVSTRESTRENTPVVTQHSREVSAVRATETDAVRQVHDHLEGDEDDDDDNEVVKKEQEPFRMTGTYKMFHISSNMDCTVTPLEYVPDRSIEHQPSEHSLSQSTKDSQTGLRPIHNNQAESDLASSQGPEPGAISRIPPPVVIDALTKPTAEITFLVESGETETENMVSSITGIKCEFSGSVPTSPLNSYPSSKTSSPTRLMSHDDSSSTLVDITESAEVEQISGGINGEFESSPWSNGSHRQKVDDSIQSTSYMSHQSHYSDIQPHALVTNGSTGSHHSAPSYTKSVMGTDQNSMPGASQIENISPSEDRVSSPRLSDMNKADHIESFSTESEHSHVTEGSPVVRERIYPEQNSDVRNSVLTANDDSNVKISENKERPTRLGSYSTKYSTRERSPYMEHSKREQPPYMDHSTRERSPYMEYSTRMDSTRERSPYMEHSTRMDSTRMDSTRMDSTRERSPYMEHSTRKDSTRMDSTREQSPYMEHSTRKDSTRMDSTREQSPYMEHSTRMDSTRQRSPYRQHSPLPQTITNKPGPYPSSATNSQHAPRPTSPARSYPSSRQHSPHQYSSDSHSSRSSLLNEESERYLPERHASPGYGSTRYTPTHHTGSPRPGTPTGSSSSLHARSGSSSREQSPDRRSRRQPLPRRRPSPRQPATGRYSPLSSGQSSPHMQSPVRPVESPRQSPSSSTTPKHSTTPQLSPALKHSPIIPKSPPVPAKRDRIPSKQPVVPPRHDEIPEKQIPPGQKAKPSEDYPWSKLWKKIKPGRRSSGDVTGRRSSGEATVKSDASDEPEIANAAAQATSNIINRGIGPDARRNQQLSGSPAFQKKQFSMSPPSVKKQVIPRKSDSMESTYFTPPQSPTEHQRMFGNRRPSSQGNHSYSASSNQSYNTSSSYKSTTSDPRSAGSAHGYQRPGHHSWSDNGGSYTSSTPRRPLSDSTNDSGISVALRAPPSRIITYRDPISPAESHSEISESFMMSESSDGDEASSVYELDLPYDVPTYIQHPDWMSRLPEYLHEVPITQLIIPGSHISLAIDRDMRMDMDFSKCNYEMAEFLRKLPNLAIFNNFRGLMKKIWKAWMPKQTLTLPQQLDAGVRYLDLRITKLRGAVYGEHGLYTRQLKRYLKEIREFLEAHPKEVIILHFQSLNQLERSDKRHLVTNLFQTFGACLARSGVPGLTTMASLWKNKKQVIVVLPDEDMSLLRNHIFYGLVWSDFEVEAPYPKTKTIDELKSYLSELDGEESPAVHAAADDKLHVLKAVLSPDMTMVFGDFKYRSMREMTEEETEFTILNWIFQNPTRKLNIVAIDFVGIGTAVSEILQLNYPRRETDV